jgi:hypothetical protein
MKPALFVLLAFALSPAIARADLVYKCKAVKFSDEKTANLRFGEFGRSGGIEVEHWNGYPPLSLVSAELKTPTQKDGKAIFQSEVDPLWGYSAELTVPSSFLRMDFFEANITLIKGGKRAPIAFNCNRF